MTIALNPSNSEEKQESTMNLDNVRPTRTFEQIIAECEISKKALIQIDNMKAVLTTDDLRYEFMMRVPFDPTGLDISRLISQMRKEQLEINTMSDEAFMDIYMLNPLEALTQYFKHSIVPAHIERMQLWGIDIKDVIELKKKDNNIHFDNVMMALYN